MTVRLRLLSASAVALAFALAFALAAPAAFADDTMGKDGMSKSNDSKMTSPSTGGHMQMPKSGAPSMKKDGMSDSKSQDGGMSK